MQRREDCGALEPSSFGLAVPTRGNEASFAIALQRLADELDSRNDPGVHR